MSATIRSRYGDDYFAKIGAKGGRSSKKGGYYFHTEEAKWNGFHGGFIAKPSGGSKLTAEQRELLAKLVKQLRDKYGTYDKFSGHIKEEREWIKKQLAKCSPANQQ